MSDLLLMSPPGLPRNGLVLLADPYRDAYGLDAAARAALQTGVDYSGRGNTLTYGATTGASTDDPLNTGTAWSFDGGDYLLCNGLRDSLKGKTACTVYIVAQRGSTTDAVDRGLLSGSGESTATDNGIGIFDRLRGTENLRLSVGNGTTYSTVALTAGRLPQTPTIVTCRFIGGSEVAIKTQATAWSKTTESVVANIKASITVNWFVGCYWSEQYFLGNIFAIAAYPQAHGDSTVARVERYLISEMAKRGVTVA